MIARVARGALPFLALAVLAGTLAWCARLARAAGHLRRELWSLHPPVISSFGVRAPERPVFIAGFALLGAIVALTFELRARSLARDPRVVGPLAAASRAATASGFASVAAMQVMAWLPDGSTPLHLWAALATFGLLAAYELLHAGICWRLAGASSTGPGRLAAAWLAACPLAALVFVWLWIGHRSAPAQYAAVACQFAYFLPLAPTLAGG